MNVQVPDTCQRPEKVKVQSVIGDHIVTAGNENTWSFFFPISFLSDKQICRRLVKDIQTHSCKWINNIRTRTVIDPNGSLTLIFLYSPLLILLLSAGSNLNWLIQLQVSTQGARTKRSNFQCNSPKVNSLVVRHSMMLACPQQQWMTFFLKYFNNVDSTESRISVWGGRDWRSLLDERTSKRNINQVLVPSFNPLITMRWMNLHKNPIKAFIFVTYPSLVFFVLPERIQPIAYTPAVRIITTPYVHHLLFALWIHLAYQTTQKRLILRKKINWNFLC